MILSDCDILRLENALGEFETEVVVADFPADWLSANKNHVYTICKALPVNVLTDFSAVGVIYPVSSFVISITLRSHCYLFSASLRMRWRVSIPFRKQNEKSETPTTMLSIYHSKNFPIDSCFPLGKSFLCGERRMN